MARRTLHGRKAFLIMGLHGDHVDSALGAEVGAAVFERDVDGFEVVFTLPAVEIEAFLLVYGVICENAHHLESLFSQGDSGAQRRAGGEVFFGKPIAQNADGKQVFLFHLVEVSTL